MLSRGCGSPRKALHTGHVEAISPTPLENLPKLDGRMNDKQQLAVLPCKPDYLDRHTETAVVRRYV